MTPVKGSFDNPLRGHNPQIENHCPRVWTPFCITRSPTSPAHPARSHVCLSQHRPVLVHGGNTVFDVVGPGAWCTLWTRAGEFGTISGLRINRGRGYISQSTCGQVWVVINSELLCNEPARSSGRQMQSRLILITISSSEACEDGGGLV